MEFKLYLRMLQRGWWVVVLTALTAMLVALITSYMTTPIYSSSSRYIISPNPSYLGGEVDYNLIYSLDTLDKRSIITTYAEVLNSPRIVSDTIKSIGYDDAQIAEYSFSAVVFPETNIIDFTVTGPDPKTVVLLVTSVGQNAVSYVEGLYQIYDMDLLDPASIPDTPISPQPLRDAGVALLIGFTLGIGLVLVQDLVRIPLVNIIEQRKMDEASQVLNKSAYFAILREVALAPAHNLCLCQIHLQGLRDYLQILPEPTLNKIFQQVTRVLKNQLRGNDLIGKWGDVEFSILLSDTDGQAAWDTMNRVKIALSQPVSVDLSGENLYLEPLIGIAEYRVGDTVESFIENANWAVETAKIHNDVYLLKATEPI